MRFMIFDVFAVIDHDIKRDLVSLAILLTDVFAHDRTNLWFSFTY